MGMCRRDFLLSALAPVSTLMTVRGPVTASSLGIILPHEHLFSMFGEEPSEEYQYDTKFLLATVVPYLENLRAQRFYNAYGFARLDVDSSPNTVWMTYGI